MIVKHQDWADPWHGALPDIVLGADLLYDPGELHLQDQPPPACLFPCVRLSNCEYMDQRLASWVSRVIPRLGMSNLQTCDILCQLPKPWDCARCLRVSKLMATAAKSFCDMSASVWPFDLR